MRLLPNRLSFGSSTIASSAQQQESQSVATDVENPAASNDTSVISPLGGDESWSTRSPATIKAPTSRREPPAGSPAKARPVLPNVLPTNRSSMPPIPPRKKDLLDRVFERVEATVCRVGSEPEMPVVMKKRVVVIEEPHDIEEPPIQISDCRDENFEPSPLLRSTTPVRSILKKKKYGKPRESDFLDYFFDNVENMVCRDERAEDNRKDDNSIVAHGDDSEESPSPEFHKLYKLPPASRGTVQKQYRKDVLDYMFECGNQDDTDATQLKIYPTPAKDRDILDYMFECGAGDVEEGDGRDPNERVPPHLKQAGKTMLPRDSNSIISEVISAGSEDSSRIGRVELLRNKKRKMEEQWRMFQLHEPQSRYLVPHAYREKVFTITSSQPQVISRAEALALRMEYERNQRIRRTVIVGIVMFLVGTALILIAASFFWPTGVP